MQRKSSRSSNVRRWDALVVLAATGVMAGCHLLTSANDYWVEDADDALPDGASTPIDDGGPRPGAPTDVEPARDSGATDALADVAAPPTSKLVFVTSKRVAGNIGSSSAADIICRDAARAAGLAPKEWRAWISTQSEPAISRIEYDGPYTLLDGTTVATDKEQLRSGRLSSPISIMESGDYAPTNADDIRVWTGTRADGSMEMTCLNWSTSSGVEFGILGSLIADDASWTRAPGQVIAPGGWRCQTPARLYCFER